MTGSSTGKRRELYRRIFAGAQTPEQVAQAIARAVRMLREAMEREDNASVTAAHAGNLADIAAEDLAEAYAEAERTAVYWPSPGRIRELAGWREEGRALEALQWVLNYLRAHGVQGHPKSGAARFVEDGGGRRALADCAIDAPAPEIPEEIALALAALARGRICESEDARAQTDRQAVRAGLQIVAQHPAAQSWTGNAAEEAAAAAERIERAWVRRYRETLRPPSPSRRNE